MKDILWVIKMSDKRRIDELLKLFKSLLEQHPTYKIDSKEGFDMVYHNLIFNSVKESDRKVSLDNEFSSKYNGNSVFDNFQEYFKNDSSINVFVSPTWQYFCQFKSNPIDITYNHTHIKMYIPLDYDHIERGVKELFDFISRNNILHTSKVSKRIRFDDVVVRVMNPEDADKILDYVKNNNYIQEGLIEASPFAFKKDGIALACDGYASYNEIMSGLIAKFLAKQKKEHKLYRANYQNLYNYIIDEYHKKYIDGLYSDIDDIIKVLDNEKIEYDYQGIIFLIIRSQKSNFSYDDFIKYYEAASGHIRDLNEFTKEAIQIQANKYDGDTLGAIACIDKTIETYDFKYITRSEGLRDKMKNSNYVYQMRSMLKNNNIDFLDYVNTF